MIIQKEYFKYKKTDLIKIIVSLLVWYIISYLINLIPRSFSKLIFLTFLLSMILMITIMCINRFGVLIVFYLIQDIIGFKIPMLEGLQSPTMPTLIFVGLMFELLFLLLNLAKQNKTSAKAISLSLSNSMMLIFLAGVLSYNLLLENLMSIINLSIELLLANFAGCMLGFLIWQSLRTCKFILKQDLTTAVQYNIKP